MLTLLLPVVRQALLGADKGSVDRILSLLANETEKTSRTAG
jgi:hypothetical protein